MVNKVKWTKEEINYLKDNYLKRDYEKLAKDFNRSYRAVIMKRYKLNLPIERGQKKLPEKSRKKMSKTRKRLMKEGKVKPPLKLPDKKGRQIIKLYDKGLKTLKIAKRVGCSRVSVSRYTKSKRDKKRTEQVKEFKNNLKRLPESDRGYIAGILDGEGSIIIQRTTTYKKPNKVYYTAVFNISNQDKRIIDYIYKRLNLWTKILSNSYGNYKPVFSMWMYGKDIITEFLNFILPYCHSEKTEKRARIMLDFCKAKTHQERKRLKKKMTQNYHYKKTIKNDKRRRSKRRT